MPDAEFLGIHLRTWIVGGAILVLVAIAHLALGWWGRRRSRRDENHTLEPGGFAHTRHWIARGLSEAVPPIALMLWEISCTIVPPISGASSTKFPFGRKNPP